MQATQRRIAQRDPVAERLLRLIDFVDWFSYLYLVWRSVWAIAFLFVLFFGLQRHSFFAASGCVVRYAGIVPWRGSAVALAGKTLQANAFRD
jgi:hypothetical protein